MTKRQKQLFNMLKGGGALRYLMGGWYLIAGRKLRVETEDALIATGELVQIDVRGRLMAYTLIVHKDHVDTVMSQRPNHTLLKVKHCV